MPTAYRVELAKSARSVCRNTACKKNGLSIQKNEMRFGSWVDFDGEHGNFHWKHWGCVTPSQLQSWWSLVEEDMDLIDGFDEIPPELQAKVSGALHQGHVDDEDWNGDVEMNRPGMKGMRMTKKMIKEREKAEGKVKDEHNDDQEANDRDATADDEKKDAQNSSQTLSVKRVFPADHVEERRPSKKAKTNARDKVEEFIDDDEATDVPTKKKGKSKAKKKAAPALKTEDDSDDAATLPQKRGSKRNRSKAAVKAESDDDLNLEIRAPKTEPDSDNGDYKPQIHGMHGGDVEHEESGAKLEEDNSQNLQIPAFKMEEDSDNAAMRSRTPVSRTKQKSKVTIKAEADDSMDPGIPAPKKSKVKGKKTSAVVPAENVNANGPDNVPLLKEQKKRGRRQSKADQAAPEEEDDDKVAEEALPAPKKIRGRAAKKQEVLSDEQNEEEATLPIPTKTRGRPKKTAAVVTEEADDPLVTKSLRGRRRKT